MERENKAVLIVKIILKVILLPANLSKYVELTFPVVTDKYNIHIVCSIG